MQTFEENPNPNAKIAFVISTPFFFYVCKNIIKYIPNAEFVISDVWLDREVKNNPDYIGETISLLKKHGQHWRIITTKTRDEPEIEAFFSKYQLIAAMRPGWPLSSLFNGDDWFYKKKTVLISYGAGKDLVTLKPLNARFDIILSEGQHTHELHSLIGTSYVVGAAKFDDWFNNNVDQNEILKIRPLLDKRKKNILYLPTHGEFSSLRCFSEQISNLAKTYNVLVKFHHLNLVSEAKWVEKIRKSGDIIKFGPADDILPLFSLADVILSDSSSASLEAILIDKPLVILDSVKNAENFQVTGHDGYWISASQYYSESIEQQIKKNEHSVCEVVDPGGNLSDAIEKALQLKFKHTANRNSLRERLFSYNDGKCGARAAETIISFLKGGNNKPKPPIIGAAIRSHLLATNQRVKIEVKKKNEKIKALSAEVKRLKRELF
ncbi:MAG: CDP-glycerol glycerophosphotransferase family protein [bacterium]|nr:CDP-glycerol glycerophosphotransferase family protein [bacterium]